MTSVVTRRMGQLNWVIGVGLVAALFLAVGPSGALAGPPPPLSKPQAAKAAGKFIRSVAAGVDEPATGSVGTCLRINRSRFRCSTSLTYPSNGEVCLISVAVWNSQTDKDGYFYRRTRGGSPNCSGAAPVSGGGAYAGVGPGHWINSISYDGRIVTLEAGRFPGLGDRG